VRAAVLHAYNSDFLIQDVETPVPGPGEVRVKIAAAGVCHSDLHVLRGKMERRGFPPPPWILGHENAGWVEAVGAGVTGFEVGEPVAVFGGWGCGRCRFCAGGQEQLCDTLSWSGLGRRWGGYAEALLVPQAEYLVPLGDLDPVVAAPLTDAALSAYRAVKKAQSRLLPGSTIVLIGAGGLGQYAIQIARALSPTRVVVVDSSPSKRLSALALGADEAVDPDDITVDDVRGLCGGEGAAAALDFVGVGTTMQLASSCVARGGLVVVVGRADRSAPFSFVDQAREAVLTTSSWGTRNELVEVLALAQRGLISGAVERYPLNEINSVFARLVDGRVDGRAVLIP
jgi:propanol-preferring alcohol dehydrogenase